MACFVVPAAEAIIVTIAAKAAKSKENSNYNVALKDSASGDFAALEQERPAKIPFSRKLKWLSNLLWGGAVLLAFEHVWHGEVVPWFPFLTNAANPADAAVMLHEMATAGVMMAVVVTVAWAGMLLVSGIAEKKSQATAVNAETNTAA